MPAFVIYSCWLQLQRNSEESIVSVHLALNQTSYFTSVKVTGVIITTSTIK